MVARIEQIDRAFEGGVMLVTVGQLIGPAISEFHRNRSS